MDRNGRQRVYMKSFADNLTISFVYSCLHGCTKSDTCLLFVAPKNTCIMSRQTATDTRGCT